MVTYWEYAARIITPKKQLPSAYKLTLFDFSLLHLCFKHFVSFLQVLIKTGFDFCLVLDFYTIEDTS